jgi:hypothetical protein
MEDVRNTGFGIRVVACDVHVWWPAFDLGPEHQAVRDDVECFHHFRVRDEALQLFTTGVVPFDGKVGKPTFCEIQWIGCVDYDLAGEARSSCSFDDFAVGDA